MRYWGISFNIITTNTGWMFWKAEEYIEHDSSVGVPLSLTLLVCNVTDSKIFSWLIDSIVWTAEATFSPHDEMSSLSLPTCHSASMTHPLHSLRRIRGQMDPDASMWLSWQTSLLCRSRRPAHIYLKYLERKGCFGVWAFYNSALIGLPMGNPAPWPRIIDFPSLLQ